MTDTAPTGITRTEPFLALTEEGYDRREAIAAETLHIHGHVFRNPKPGDLVLEISHKVSPSRGDDPRGRAAVLGYLLAREGDTWWVQYGPSPEDVAEWDNCRFIRVPAAAITRGMTCAGLQARLAEANNTILGIAENGPWALIPDPALRQLVREHITDACHSIAATAGLDEAMEYTHDLLPERLPLELPAVTAVMESADSLREKAVHHNQQTIGEESIMPQNTSAAWDDHGHAVRYGCWADKLAGNGPLQDAQDNGYTPTELLAAIGSTPEAFREGRIVGPYGVVLERGGALGNVWAVTYAPTECNRGCPHPASGLNCCDLVGQGSCQGDCGATDGCPIHCYSPWTVDRILNHQWKP